MAAATLASFRDCFSRSRSLHQDRVTMVRISSRTTAPSAAQRIGSRARKNSLIGQSSSTGGRSTVCPASACVQSPRNWMRPSTMKE